MPICETCTALTSPVEGTVYNADEFRELVRRGFENSRLDVNNLEAWKDLVARSTKSWLLCPACASRASAVMPQAGPGAGTYADSTQPATPSSDPLAEVGRLLQEGLGPTAESQAGPASIPEALPVADVVASAPAAADAHAPSQPRSLPPQQNANGKNWWRGSGRILALDWDQKVVHLVSARLSRGEAHIDRAVQWQEDFDLTETNAEDAGRRLRDRLKEMGFGAAPVIVCLGRERIILKDVRYPQVPPSEEPALIRFQASKELTDNPEDVLIDFTLLREPGPLGEKQATAVILRRDILGAYKKLCMAAGLKLAAVTPRPFGASGAVERAAGNMLIPAPSSPDDVLAVLTLGVRWAELCIVKSGTLLFARSLSVGTTLPGEVKRSLAVYAGSGTNRTRPSALYLAGNGEHAALRERLQDLLDLPVHPLDPFAREEQVEVDAKARGGFTGAVGLIHQWGKRESLPINFVRLKEVEHEANPTKRRWILGGAVAAVLFIGLFVFSQMALADADAERVARQQMRDHLNDSIARLQVESADFAAIKEWDQTTVDWLDELYDLTARMEYQEGFKVTHLGMKEGPGVAAAGKKAALKDKDAGPPAIGQLVINGLMPQDKDIFVHNLYSKLANDKHLSPTLNSLKPAGVGREFSLTVDVHKQPVQAYTEILDVSQAQPVARPKGKGAFKGFGKKGGGQ